METNYYLLRERERVVADYQRVSTDHEEQLAALKNQSAWMKNLFERHSNWTHYQSYVDEGITGTNTDKRVSFNKMLEDARAGKFDLIVCRDVCRFARNTVDSLSYTRELRNIGVEVYFVDDGIWSCDPDGEYRLTMMSANAQDESRRCSVRAKNGQEISRQKGVIYGNGNILGYDKIAPQKYVVNEEQATTVRIIFDWYTINGWGAKKIKFELEKMGRKTAMGLSKWSEATISRILKNTKYMGVETYGKSYTEDYLTHKRIINMGEKEMMQKEVDIPVIISKEQFMLAQKIRLSKTEYKKAMDDKRMVRSGRKRSLDVWCRKMICSCGGKFNRKTWHNTGSGPQYGYACYRQISTGTVETRKRKGLSTEGICQSKMWSGWKLDMMAHEVFKNIFYNKKKVLEIAMKAIEKHIDDIESDSTVLIVKSLKREIEKNEKRLDNYTEMRADGEITKEVFLSKKKEIEETIENINEQLREYGIDNIQETKDILYKKLEELKKALEKKVTIRKDRKVSEALIDAFVDKIVVEKGKCKWYLNFSNGTIIMNVNGVHKNDYNTTVNVFRDYSDYSTLSLDCTKSGSYR